MTIVNDVLTMVKMIAPSISEDHDRLNMTIVDHTADHYCI